MLEQKKQKISIIIPVYNEEGNVANLHKELTEVMGLENREYEIIFIDDCSYDKTLDVLREIFNQDKHTQIISLMGNQGKAAALNSGLKHASGDIIIIMDGDGQHNPNDIPQFISAIENGYDVASGWKIEDKGRSKIKSIIHNSINKFIGKIMGVKMKYFGVAMKAYKKNIIDHLELSGDLHRFAGALIYYKGIKIKEIPINIRPRETGVSKYNFNNIVGKVFLDVILVKFLTKYSKTPFRIFGPIGFFFGILGSIGIIYVAITKYLYNIAAFHNISIIIIAAIGITIGIQFIFFGLMAEMISRIYYTSNERGLHTTKEYLKH